MNAFNKGMTALVVLGVLLAATMLWISSNGLNAERPAALALNSNVQSPDAVPAPAPLHKMVVRANHESNAQDKQPAPLPAPAHSK